MKKNEQETIALYKEESIAIVECLAELVIKDIKSMTKWDTSAEIFGIVDKLEDMIEHYR